MLDCAGDAESLVQGSVKALPAGLRKVISYCHVSPTEIIALDWCGPGM